jgi:hypothetical protein
MRAYLFLYFYHASAAYSYIDIAKLSHPTNTCIVAFSENQLLVCVTALFAPRAPSAAATLPLGHLCATPSAPPPPLLEVLCASARELLCFVDEFEREGVLVQKEKRTGSYV